MGQLVAITEKGQSHFTCTAHIAPVSGTGSTYPVGSPNVFINGKSVVRLGDPHANGCGHTFTAVTGSTTVFVNGLPIHRLNDNISGSGSGNCVVPGQTTVFAGG